MRIAKLIFRALALGILITSSYLEAQNSPHQHSGQAPPLAPVVEPTRTLTLEELQQMALVNNPTLKQAEANIETARGRLKQAGLYPNPTVGYIGEEISPGPIIRGGEHGFFLDQTIVLGGKLGKNREVFLQALRRAEADADAQRVRVANAVRGLYYEALSTQQRIELRQRLVSLATQAVETSYGLFNVGQSDKPDILAVEIEAQQLKLALEIAKHGQLKTWKRLAAVVGSIHLTPVPLSGNLDSFPQLDGNALLAEILNKSPEIKAAQVGVAEAQAAVSKARADRIPDLEISGGLLYNRELLELDRQPVGREGLVKVSIRLPLFNRNQGNILAAQSELVAAQQEVRRREHFLRARFGEVFSQYESARLIAVTYKNEVLLRARQAHELYVTKFREMTAAYPQVLVAGRRLLQLNDDYLAALENVWDAVTLLEGFLLEDGFQNPGTRLELQTKRRSEQLQNFGNFANVDDF